MLKKSEKTILDLFLYLDNTKVNRVYSGLRLIHPSLVEIFSSFYVILLTNQPTNRQG